MGSALMVALAVLASGIQWGWQSLPDGGREYIVQVEPQLTDLESFRKGGFFSDVPPTLRDIRQIRVVVGNEPLPNQGQIPAAPAPLPPGVAAAPLNPAPSNPAPSNAAPSRAVTENPSKTAGEKHGLQPAPISLTDGRQPVENVKAAAPVATEKSKAAAETQSPQIRAEKPAGESPVATAAIGPRPWLPLVLVAGGLIVSMAGNAFLGWVHWGTRNQYRSLVSQLRTQRNPAAT